MNCTVIVMPAFVSLTEIDRNAELLICCMLFEERMFRNEIIVALGLLAGSEEGC